MSSSMIRARLAPELYASSTACMRQQDDGPRHVQDSVQAQHDAFNQGGGGSPCVLSFEAWERKVIFL